MPVHAIDNFSTTGVLYIYIYVLDCVYQVRVKLTFAAGLAFIHVFLAVLASLSVVRAWVK